MSSDLVNINPLGSYSHIVQMFEAGLGHAPSAMTLTSMNASNLSNAHLAAAFVSSQAFANVNNAGVLLNPNVTASLAVVESLFQNTLGHHPTAATLAGFEGMTNAQAFLAFALSDTVSSVVGNEVNTYVQDYAQAEGIITTVVGAADINLFSTNIG
jgi:predicted membrane protein